MSPLTSVFGSNMFFKNKQSLGTPIVSMVGIAVAGSWRPGTGSPGIAGTEPDKRGATAGDTTGVAPRIGAVGRVGVPSEPAILKRKEVDVNSIKSGKFNPKEKFGRGKPWGSASTI